MTKRLFTLFFALVATLAGLEIGIRIYQRIFPGYSPGVQFSTFDPNLGWRHVRGISGKFRGPDFETDVRVNQLGLRGHDIQAGKPDANTFRILFLGDSVTAGFEVNEQETFVAKVQNMLNKCGNGSIRFEAVNAGVRGYGTDQSLIYYERQGKKLGASLIVYTLVQNDIFENTRKVGLNRYYPKPRFQIYGDTLSLETARSGSGQSSAKGFLSAAERFLRFRSRIYGWINNMISRSTMSGLGWILDIYPEYSVSMGKAIGQPAVLFRALLKRLLEDVREEGARLIVQINPADFELSRTKLVRLLALQIPEDVLKASNLDPDAFHDKYRKIIESLGIPVVVSLPAFRKISDETKWPYVLDGHPNKVGHTLIAQLLLKRILLEGLVPLDVKVANRCLSSISR